MAVFDVIPHTNLMEQVLRSISMFRNCNEIDKNSRDNWQRAIISVPFLSPNLSNNITPTPVSNMKPTLHGYVSKTEVKLRKNTP